MKRGAVVLYDAECTFCRACVALLLAWDSRGRRIRPVALQAPEAASLLPGTNEEERMESLHLVPPGGEPRSAGAAAAPLLRLLPGGGPLAALAERFPGATQRSYEVMAGHRGNLGRLIPDALSRRADKAVRARS